MTTTYTKKSTSENKIQSYKDDQTFTHYKPTTSNNYIKQQEKPMFELKKKLLSSGHGYSSSISQGTDQNNFLKVSNLKNSQSQFRTSNNKSTISQVNNASFNNSQINQSYIITNQNSNINNFLNASKLKNQVVATVDQTGIEESDFKDKILKKMKLTGSNIRNNYISTSSNAGNNFNKSNYKTYLNNDNLQTNSKLKTTLITSVSNKNDSLSSSKYSRNNNNDISNSNTSNYNLYNTNTYLPQSNIPNVNVNVSHIRIDLNDKKYNNKEASSDERSNSQMKLINYPRPDTKQSSYNKEREDILYSIESQLNHILTKNSKEDDISQNEDNLNKTMKNLSSFKKLFEDLILNVPEYGRILKKLNYGYNEVIQNILQGYNMMKIKKENSDEMINKYNNLNKKYNESLKLIKDYKEENIMLNEKLNFLQKEREREKESTISINKMKQESKKNNKFLNTEETDTPIKQSSSSINAPNVVTGGSSMTMNNINTEESNEHGGLIRDINSKLINDLEALYFPDKVKTRSKSIAADKVPKLDFNFSKDTQTKSRNAPQLPIQQVNQVNNTMNANVNNNVSSTLSKIKNLKTHFSSSNYNNSFNPLASTQSKPYVKQASQYADFKGSHK